MVDATRVLRGALAGATAAGVWAAQQPLDMWVFGVDYDDAELLGSVVTRERDTLATFAVGNLLHVANGALFGALYSLVAPRLPGPAAARGLTAGMAEHLATWPSTRYVAAAHPVGGSFPALWGDHRAFGQAVWRHALFGVVLGELERRLNPPVDAAGGADAGPDPQSNGHAHVERVVVSRA